MAWGNFVLDIGYNASGLINKYRVVKFTANPEEVTAVTAITDQPAGVEQFGVTAAEILKGKGSSVRVLGVSETEAAGAIAAGNMCQLEADGRVTAAVGASGKRLVGKCMGQPAGVAGDRIAMLVIHGLGLS